MRALWTSASGLTAQQLRLDVLSNNISNVNSTGYKASDASFQELLQGQASTLPDHEEVANLPRSGAPDLRLANGVRSVGLRSDFAQGNLQTTQQPFDVAIEGEGFFQLQAPEDVGKPLAQQNPIFTRDGHFHLDAKGSLVNDEGYHVVDQATNAPIQVDPAQLQGAEVSIDDRGNLSLRTKGQPPVSIGAINYVLFTETPEANLNAIGNKMYALKPSATLQPADRYTGAYFATAPDQIARIGQIRQGTLEMANVDLGKTMTDLIQVQRAYDFNSRAIQTTDQMMGMANNMRA